MTSARELTSSPKEPLRNHLHNTHHRPSRRSSSPMAVTRSSDNVARYETSSHTQKTKTKRHHHPERQQTSSSQRASDASAPLWSRLTFPSIEATALRRELVAQVRQGRIRHCVVCDATRANDALPSLLLHLLGHLEDTLSLSYGCGGCGARFPLEPLLAEHARLCSTSRQRWRCVRTSVVSDRRGERVQYDWGCDGVATTQSQYDQHVAGQDGTACAAHRARVVDALRAQIMRQIGFLKPQAASLARDDLASYLRALRRQIYAMDAETGGSDENAFCVGCDQVIRAAGEDLNKGGRTKRVDSGDTQFLINALGVAELDEEPGA